MPSQCKQKRSRTFVWLLAIRFPDQWIVSDATYDTRALALFDARNMVRRGLRIRVGRAVISWRKGEVQP